MPTIRSRILKRQTVSINTTEDPRLNANDPFEDTETERGRTVYLSARAGLNANDPFEDTETANPAAVFSLVKRGLNANDPFEDTETRCSSTTNRSANSVSMPTIRSRILKLVSGAVGERVCSESQCQRSVRGY